MIHKLVVSSALTLGALSKRSYPAEHAQPLIHHTEFRAHLDTSRRRLTSSEEKEGVDEAAAAIVNQFREDFKKMMPQCALTEFNEGNDWDEECEAGKRCKALLQQGTMQVTMAFAKALNLKSKNILFERFSNYKLKDYDPKEPENARLVQRGSDRLDLIEIFSQNIFNLYEQEGGSEGEPNLINTEIYMKFLGVIKLIDMESFATVLPKFIPESIRTEKAFWQVAYYAQLKSYLPPSIQGELTEDEKDDRRENIDYAITKTNKNLKLVAYSCGVEKEIVDLIDKSRRSNLFMKREFQEHGNGRKLFDDLYTNFLSC